MKAFLELVNQRQSVRSYSNRSVEKEKLEKCLEAARLAPSACNSQPWHYIVVDDAGLKQKIARETTDPVTRMNRFADEAPILVVIILEKPKIITQIGEVIKNKEYPLIDLGVTAEHFCLQAAELGMGTCMMGWFNQKPIQKLLNIPRNKNIGLIISLGYPSEGYKQRQKVRKKKDEIISFNTY